MVASQLVLTECQVLLIFTTVLQRRSYYPVLQINRQTGEFFQVHMTVAASGFELTNFQGRGSVAVR